MVDLSERSHRVVSGDTLSAIAVKYYGSYEYTPVLLEANRRNLHEQYVRWTRLQENRWNWFQPRPTQERGINRVGDALFVGSVLHIPGWEETNRLIERLQLKVPLKGLLQPTSQPTTTKTVLDPDVLLEELRKMQPTATVYVHDLINAIEKARRSDEI